MRNLAYILCNDCTQSISRNMWSLLVCSFHQLWEILHGDVYDNFSHRPANLPRYQPTWDREYKFKMSFSHTHKPFPSTCRLMEIDVSHLQGIGCRDCVKRGLPEKEDNNSVLVDICSSSHGRRRRIWSEIAEVSHLLEYLDT